MDSSFKCSDCGQYVKATPPFEEGLSLKLDQAAGAWMVIPFRFCILCHDSLPESGDQRQIALAQLFQRKNECSLTLVNVPSTRS